MCRKFGGRRRPWNSGPSARAGAPDAAAGPAQRMASAARMAVTGGPRWRPSLRSLVVRLPASARVGNRARHGSAGAPGAIRTRTARPLRPLPLPLGYECVPLGAEDSNLQPSGPEPDVLPVAPAPTDGRRAPCPAGRAAPGDRGQAESSAGTAPRPPRRERSPGCCAHPRPGCEGCCLDGSPRRWAGPDVGHGRGVDRRVVAPTRRSGETSMTMGGDVSDHVTTARAPGAIRTHTGRGLSALPLPLGYRSGVPGREPCPAQVRRGGSAPPARLRSTIRCGILNQAVPPTRVGEGGPSGSYPASRLFGSCRAPPHRGMTGSRVSGKKGRPVVDRRAARPRGNVISLSLCATGHGAVAVDRSGQGQSARHGQAVDRHRSEG